MKGTLNCQTFAVHLRIVDVLRNEISGQCGTCKTVEKVCKKVVVIKVLNINEGNDIAKCSRKNVASSENTCNCCYETRDRKCWKA